MSVLRESIPLDRKVASYVTRMLAELEWHGVAMVEFKHDEARDDHILMEINPRFQASTALSLDAGLNLPQLVAHLYGCAPAPRVDAGYRIGVRERWLRGDLTSLAAHLGGSRCWASEGCRKPIYWKANNRAGSAVGACSALTLNQSRNRD